MGNESLDRALHRAGRGDIEGIADLYDEIGPAMYGLARRVLHDDSAAEAATLEAFRGLCRQVTRHGETPHGWAAREWVAGVTIRAITAEYRRGRGQLLA